MGVDLGDFAAARPLEWEELRGRVLAIDAYNTLYQFLTSARQADGTPLMDTKGRATGHLSGLFYRSVKWLEGGLKPVFVFDGKPPQLKARTLQERKERKIEAARLHAEALSDGRIEDARIHAQATTRLTPEMVQQAKDLLTAMGIPHIQAPSEGEAEAADLVKRGVAWASVSQDFDSLLFGAPRLVRNLSNSGRRKLPRRDEYVDIGPEMLELEAVLDASGLNQYQLVWMGLLVGTDFNAGVKGVGPKKALKLVSGAHSFDEVVAKLKASTKVPEAPAPGAGAPAAPASGAPPEPQAASSAQASGSAEATAVSAAAAPSAPPQPEMPPAPLPGLENWEAVEDFFHRPPVSGTAEVKFGKPDRERVLKLLCTDFDFSPDRVGRTLDALVKQQKEVGSQRRLGDW